MILQDGEASCGLELLIVQRHQVSFGFLNLKKHLFTEFFSGLNLVPVLFSAFGES
jgi:hypothetical protein